MRGPLARRLASPPGILVLYTLIALVLTAPLALQLGDHLLATDSNALNDTYFSVWIFGWQAHQLIADPLNLFQGNIFYPFQNSLAFSEIILPGALFYLPLEYATGNPVLAYNLVLLLSFPLNAFAMYLFAYDWLRDIKTDSARDARLVLPAFLAGLVFAFCSYKMGELRHIQLLFALFMPLTLLYVKKFLRTPNLHNGLITALFFALNALASLYYAVFLAFAVVLYVAIELVRRRFRLTRAHWLYGAVSLGIAVLIVLPFLLPFLRLEREYNFSEGRDPNLFSARPASYLAAPTSQWLYGTITRPFYVASKGQPLFPGIAATLLGAIGLYALVRQRSRAWVFPLLLVVTGIVLSLGPTLILGRNPVPALPIPLPYHYLARVISPLQSLNAPARFVVLTMLGLGLLAAYGIAWLMLRTPRLALVLGVGACALVLLEYIPAPLQLTQVPTPATISPAYALLAARPRGEPVVELPMGKPTFADQDKYVEYVYNSLYHGQPLVNGYSTFLPPAYYALVKKVQSFPSKQSLARLKEWGVTWLVIHADAFGKTDKLRKKLDGRRTLEPVQDFGDIWLYRFK